METSQGLTHQYSYTPFGEIAQWDNAGIPVSYAYDANGQIQNMTTPQGSYSFNWNANGDSYPAANTRRVSVNQSVRCIKPFNLTAVQPGRVQ